MLGALSQRGMLVFVEEFGYKNALANALSSGGENLCSAADSVVK
jgi:hypothetical protein